MKKFLNYIFTFSIVLLGMMSFTSAKQLPAGRNYDYSIDLFNDTYYITYDEDGGILNNRKTTFISQDEDIEIGIPVKDGYVFTGWTGTNGNIPNTKVTIKHGSVGNHSFKANWKKVEYNITYNLNGGEGDSGPIYYDSESENIILGEPYRAGYVFTGWTGSNGNNPEKEIIINKNNKQALNYKANWEKITYNIYYRYETNNKVNTTVTNSGTITNNYNVETNNFSLHTPSRVAYTFEGWIGSDNNSNNKSITINKGSIGDKFYQAMWKVITYNITYNLNGGTGVSNRTYNIETPSFDLPTPFKTGYTFTGWTGEGITSPNTKVTINQMYGNRNYSANWKANKYTVELNKQGGNGGSDSAEATYDSPMPKITPPTREGYKFEGYYTGTEGSGTQYYDENGNSTRKWDQASGDTLYAKWKKMDFIVYYNIDGVTWATRTVTYGKALENLNPQDYLGEWKTFDGWSGWVSTMPDHDVTLNATYHTQSCGIVSGHGGYDRVSTFPDVFSAAGIISRIEPSPHYPGNYWVVSDGIYTKAQIDAAMPYIWSHTSPTGNHALNWLSASCDNGYSYTYERPYY